MGLQNEEGESHFQTAGHPGPADVPEIEPEWCDECSKPSVPGVYEVDVCAPGKHPVMWMGRVGLSHWNGLRWGYVTGLIPFDTKRRKSWMTEMEIARAEARRFNPRQNYRWRPLPEVQ